MSEPLVYGGRGAAARTVIVYGNCQAPYLAKTLSAVDDFNDDYRFVVVPNRFYPGETVPCPVPDEYLRDLALVLVQYEGPDGNPCGPALRAQLPRACPVIQYPSFVMNCMWPFEAPEPRDTCEPDYPEKRYPHGDMIAQQIGQSGVRGPLAVAAYMDLSMRKMPNLEVRLQRDMDRIRAYDACCDVKLGDYVEARFRHEHLFRTHGHVSANAIAELTRRVAASARPILGGSADRTEVCVAAALWFRAMGPVEVPIHPGVASTLGLSFWEWDLTYLWYTQHWTFHEYLEHYIGFDTSW